nr:unnamed protein product [Callosobruchus analis]
MNRFVRKYISSCLLCLYHKERGSYWSVFNSELTLIYEIYHRRRTDCRRYKNLKTSSLKLREKQSEAEPKF